MDCIIMGFQSFLPNYMAFVMLFHDSLPVQSLCTYPVPNGVPFSEEPGHQMSDNTFGLHQPLQ